MPRYISTYLPVPAFKLQDLIFNRGSQRNTILTQFDSSFSTLKGQAYRPPQHGSLCMHFEKVYRLNAAGRVLRAPHCLRRKHYNFPYTTLLHHSQNGRSQ
jgi:hypothetical protein